MKRAFSQGSPPPTAPKPTKKQRKNAAAAAAAAAASSAVNTPLASSPPYTGLDSPARGRSRSRSLSIAPGDKGKGRERDETLPPGADGEGQEEDAEDEELEFSDDEYGSNQKESARQKEDLRVLLEHFDAGQMDRYEAYRRSGLTKGSVRKLVNQVLGQSVSPNILTVVRGFAKVFVGEMVERARAVSGNEGSITPEDLREAYRQYQAEHSSVAGGALNKKKMFVK